jgi:hypothetical protein
MAWHKITLPLLTDIDPKVVEIGKLVYDVYEKENKPGGFAMFHATRGSEKGLNDKQLIYLSPVAAELCREVISEKYELEPCGVPARDEPDMAYVSGDPLVMKDLKEKFEPEPGTVEWDREQERLRLEREGEELQARWEAEHAAELAAAKAAAAKAQNAQNN